MRRWVGVESGKEGRPIRTVSPGWEGQAEGRGKELMKTTNQPEQRHEQEGSLGNSVHVVRCVFCVGHAIQTLLDLETSGKPQCSQASVQMDYFKDVQEDEFCPSLAENKDWPSICQQENKRKPAEPLFYRRAAWGLVSHCPKFHYLWVRELKVEFRFVWLQWLNSLHPSVMVSKYWRSDNCYKVVKIGESHRKCFPWRVIQWPSLSCLNTKGAAKLTSPPVEAV